MSFEICARIYNIKSTKKRQIMQLKFARNKTHSTRVLGRASPLPTLALAWHEYDRSLLFCSGFDLCALFL